MTAPIINHSGRSATPYNQRKKFEAPQGYGISISGPPVAGFYRTRLTKGAVPVGVKIWFGQPLDPQTGELMDRSLRWQAHVNGEYIDLDRVWPSCARETITEIEYQRICLTQNWAKLNAPKSGLANPSKKSDPLQSPLYF